MERRLLTKLLERYSSIVNMEAPKIIVVICIFDRWENLRKWAHAWDFCDKLGAELIVVNNHYPGADDVYWTEFCTKRCIKYLKRPNTGYETGVIQDVMKGRLLSETNWDIFLFVTDDTIPIKKDFLIEYVEEVMKPDVGVACMQVSGNVTPHIRTTGWCIRKEVANNVVFPHDPVSEKGHCYHFEHTGGEDTLMSQILRMDKKVVQMSSIKESSLWDTHHTDTNRWEEWHKEFPGYINN